MSQEKFYTCETCGEEFEKKSGLDTHSNRKNKCKEGDGLNKKVKKHNCIYCGKDTSFRMDSHKVHEKTCGPKYNNMPMNIKGNDNIINTGTINNGTINNNNNNINVTVNLSLTGLIPYNQKIQLSDMKAHEIDRIFNCAIHPHVSFFESIHCNYEKVNYQNVYYIGNNVICVYNGTDFVNKDITKLINFFIRSQRISMIEFIQTTCQTICDKIIKKIHDTIMSTQILGDSSSYESESAREELKNIRKLMLASMRNTKNTCYDTYNNFIKNKKSFDTDYKKDILKKIQQLPRKMLYTSQCNILTSDSSSDSIDREIEKVEFDYNKKTPLKYDSTSSSSEEKYLKKKINLKNKSNEDSEKSAEKVSKKMQKNILSKTKSNKKSPDTSVEDQSIGFDSSSEEEEDNIQISYKKIKKHKSSKSNKKY